MANQVSVYFLTRQLYQHFNEIGSELLGMVTQSA